MSELQWLSEGDNGRQRVKISDQSFREHRGSALECLTRDKGLRVRASLSALGCVLEHGTLIKFCLVLFQPSKTCPNMTEKMLAGM